MTTWHRLPTARLAADLIAPLAERTAGSLGAPLATLPRVQQIVGEFNATGHAIRAQAAAPCETRGEPSKPSPSA